jgi:ubiquinone/menaquinone biosynthesis C-methylase UbiE
MELIIDFYKNMDYLGPGSLGETKKALSFMNLGFENLKVADIGCGTGRQTEILANELNAEIIAVDFLKKFLKSVKNRFSGSNKSVKILEANMELLPFEDNEFDLIFSEGAVYNIGFKKGIQEWKRFIKPNGFLAISEISWLTEKPPKKLEKFWKSSYSEIDTFENKISQLEQTGYKLIGNFPMANSSWENYYSEVQNNMNSFLKRNNYSNEAKEFVNECEEEIAIFKKYNEYYSYVFYIAQKI